MKSSKDSVGRFLAGLCPVGGVMVLLLAGCASPSSNVGSRQEAEVLRRDNRRLARVAEQRDTSIAELKAQIKSLRGLAPDRPIGVFHPIEIQIASLSRGADYDAAPGDDGVTVHLRLRDVDGDVVKVAGRITVQLVDTSIPGSPSAVGLCVFDDPSTLGQMWHGRFGTSHFTLPCHFGEGQTPSCRRLTVNVEFVDYQTGTTLTAVKEVTISPATE